MMMRKSRKMMALLAAGSICCVAAAEEAKPVAAPVVPVPAAPAPQADAFAGLPDVVATYGGDKKLTKADFVKAINEMAGGDAVAAGVTAEWINAEAQNIAREIILKQMVEDQLEKAGVKPSKERAAELLKTSLQQMNPQMLEMVKQQAVMQGKTIEQLIDEMASRPELQMNAAIQEFLEKKVLAEVKDVTPEEIKKFYDDNAKMFQNGPQVKVSHILYEAQEGQATEAQMKEAEEKAKAAVAELGKSPDKFAEIAKRDSACPSKEEGGQLGAFGTDARMDPAFKAAAFKLEKNGELSAPVKSSFGYHVIRLDEKIPASTTPFEAVREQLGIKLNQQKKDEASQKFFDNLEKGAAIKYNVEAPKAPAMPQLPVPAAPAAN